VIKHRKVSGKQMSTCYLLTLVPNQNS